MGGMSPGEGLGNDAEANGVSCDPSEADTALVV